MNKQEMTKTLAEKVMGWVSTRESNEPFDWGWEKPDGCFVTDFYDFDPFTNSADNDALIEAFVGKSEGLIYSKIDLNTDELIIMRLVDGRFDLAKAKFERPYTTAKKNEAVCKAIYEAIK